MNITAKELSGMHLGCLIKAKQDGKEIDGVLHHLVHYRTGINPVGVTIVSSDNAVIRGSYAIACDTPITIQEGK